MKPDNEIRVCDLCGEYYPVVIENPDYKFTYLDKHLDLCNNCYDSVVRLIKDKQKPKPPFLTRKTTGTTDSSFSQF